MATPPTGAKHLPVGWGSQPAGATVQVCSARMSPRLTSRRRLSAAIRVCSHQSLVVTPWWRSLRQRPFDRSARRWSVPPSSDAADRCRAARRGGPNRGVRHEAARRAGAGSATGRPYAVVQRSRSRQPQATPKVTVRVRLTAGMTPFGPGGGAGGLVNVRPRRCARRSPTLPARGRYRWALFRRTLNPATCAGCPRPRRRRVESRKVRSCHQNRETVSRSF